MAKQENGRSALNTTIKTEILKGFRDSCKETGFPMNLVLEAFMEQFASGEFVMKMHKANKLEIDEADKVETE